MQKSKGAENLAKLYREFSHQKHLKYRQQFPKLRQAEITKKVLKEWEDLDQQQKNSLKEKYERKSLLGDVDSDDLENPLKKKPIEKIRGSDKKVAPVAQNSDVATPSQEAITESKSSPALVKKAEQPPLVTVEQSSGDFLDSIAKNRKQDHESESGRDEADIVRGRRTPKSIANLKNSEYLSFFKFYYERLTKEHPRWTPNQLSTIIKLLWKKRQLAGKKTRKQNNKPRAPSRQLKKQKPVTAYDLFRKRREDRMVGVKRTDSFIAWKALNDAGKRFFQKEADEHNKTILSGAGLKAQMLGHIKSEREYISRRDVAPSFLNKAMDLEN